jgi:hypothetical protein
MTRVNGQAPPKLPNLSGAVLLSDWCNIYGDDINGAVRVNGGLETGKAWKQWYCPNKMIGRFRMVCEHGHRGQIMKLCQSHYNQYSGGKVTFCPRCNIPPNDHKCRLDMVPVS